MRDAKGRLIRLGDRVSISGDIDGVVVFSLDTNEFSPDFPELDWSYLGKGVMIETKQMGLIYLEESDQDIEVIESLSN